MSKDIMRSFINSCLPKGSAWNVEQDGDLDKLLDGIALNQTTVKEFLSTLADLRNPYKTPILTDLEKEFGIISNMDISEADRRKRLASVMFARGGTGSLDDMINALSISGLNNLFVYANDPAVDPSLNIKPTLVVNGESYINNILVTYTMPTNPDAFPFIFFIGGEATKDINGYIISMNYAQIDRKRKNEILTTILKYKPKFTWCGAKIILSDFNFFDMVTYDTMDANPIVKKGFSTYTTFNYGEMLKYSDIFI